jgi:hypothetical protein
MPTRNDDRPDLTLAGAWRRDDDQEPLSRWTLRTGGERYEIWTDRATADALFPLLAALPGAVERLERERDRVAADLERVTAERDALAKASRGEPRGTGPRPALAVVPKRGGGGSLADVPLSMIGTFRVDDPRVKAAAKKDPLMALAVQVAKATAPDASELEQARLRAMATAVSRGDLDTFWTASTERSKKKLAGA